MSAETAETEENVLPANLVKLASQELHDRAYELHEAASEALDSDQWPEYTRLSDQASKYDEEIDRRGDAARKAVAVEAPKNPVAAQERIDATRQQIAEAEKALERFVDVKPRGNAPPPAGQTTEEVDEPAREKALAFMNLESLRADLFAMEQRTAFLDTSDEDIAVELEDQAISLEDLRRDFKKFTDEGRRAAAAKAERQIAEATQRHHALMREDGVRKAERTQVAAIAQLAERKALRDRAVNFEDWKRRKAELEEGLHRELRVGESEHYDFAQLREATQMVEKFEKAIAENLPPGSDELAASRASVEAMASHIRGSFRD